jgi:hypothetical protein
MGETMLSYKKFVMAIGLACAFGAFTPATGAALAGTLDQSQSSFDENGTGTFVSSVNSFAQTFTAGATGTLDKVELQLWRTNAPDAPLSVELRDAPGGSPGATVLSNATLQASSVPTLKAFLAIPLNAPVTAGTKYALVAHSGTNSAFGFYTWGTSSLTNPYPRGDLFVASGSSGAGPWVTGESTGNFVGDMTFRTYVARSATSTGLRAAALKKCKKKKSKKARKKCKKKARKLPI